MLPLPYFPEASGMILSNSRKYMTEYSRKALELHWTLLLPSAIFSIGISNHVTDFGCHSVLQQLIIFADPVLFPSMLVKGKANIFLLNSALGWWLQDMQRHSSSLNYRVESVKISSFSLVWLRQNHLTCISDLFGDSLLIDCWLGTSHSIPNNSIHCGMYPSWGNFERTGGHNVSPTLHPSKAERTNSAVVWEVDYLLRPRHLITCPCPPRVHIDQNVF